MGRVQGSYTDLQQGLICSEIFKKNCVQWDNGEWSMTLLLAINIFCSLSIFAFIWCPPPDDTELCTFFCWRLAWPYLIAEADELTKKPPKLENEKKLRRKGCLKSLQFSRRLNVGLQRRAPQVSAVNLLLKSSVSSNFTSSYPSPALQITIDSVTTTNWSPNILGE